MDKVGNVADVATHNLKTGVNHATPAMTKHCFRCVTRMPPNTRPFTTHLVNTSCWPLGETDLPTLHWLNETRPKSQS